MEPAEVAIEEAARSFEEVFSKNGGWDEVCEALRVMVSNDAFQRWFRAARWLGVEDDVASIAVPGEIHQVWIETNYLPELTMAVTGIFDEVREVRVVVGEDIASPNDLGTGHPKHSPFPSRPTKAAALEGEALDKRIKAAGSV